MSRPSPAFDALNAAMEKSRPSCANDDRFIDDYIDPRDLEHLCLPCPLAELCRAYASNARPPAGIWAGRRWNSTKRKAN